MAEDLSVGGVGDASRMQVWAAEEGTPYWFLGTLVWVRASAESTANAYSVIEQVAPAGFGPPLHVHHREDEQFYVLEGSVRFRCGEREVRVEAGGSVFLPKQVPHAFHVEGDTPARLLQITAPGGFERFVEAIGVVAPSATLPPPGPPPAGLIERVAELGPAHDFAVVGPPLAMP